VQASQSGGEAQQDSAKIGQAELVRLAAALILGAAIGGGLITLVLRSRPAPIQIVPAVPTVTSVPTPTPGLIRVYVSGQVVDPAVYELPPGSIIDEAVNAAGGFTDAADRDVVNLAQPLVDGSQVYVPAVEENSTRPAVVVSTPFPPPRVDAASDSGPSGLININTAGQDALESLPGLGPTLAQRIVAYREENGPFQTIADVISVSGIGEGKFAQIESLITVGEE